ncbi:MAG: pyridoxamine 5'-phosphate oxidase family protein [Nitrospiraceae bacterium]|nr:MAG: pyridoxamine 5'-phosphate oxidase family protein [Nitrospiraceae bacterium]
MKKKTADLLPVNKKKGSANGLDRLKLLNRKQRHAVLATTSKDMPYTSLIAYALTPDMEIIFATPKNTQKYRNILNNSSIAILIDTRSNTDRGYLGAEAITALGTAHPVRRGEKWKKLVQVFLKKHSQLAGFIDAPSTALILVKVSRCVHVSRFQVVTAWSKDK